jgi:hypothetical protein
MEDPTIASLLSDAAKYLRGEFEFIRSTNKHAGDAGEEVQEVLKKFLNKHLPKRWAAESGLIIDHANAISRQTDVIVYDALSSPVYRSGDKTCIVPNNNVAAVIEVKSRLNKAQLADAYLKIASCKKLMKDQLSDLDSNPTSGPATTTTTMGIVFAFSAETLLNTLAENMAELNAQYQSSQWPDLIVVLDTGTINYLVAYPGTKGNLPGSMMTTPDPRHLGYAPPPWYVQLCTNEDGQFALNRMFMLLMTHLTVYPYRKVSPPFETLLGDASKQARMITGYQFDSGFMLKPVPEHLYESQDTPLSINLFAKDKQVGHVQYIPWQDRAVLRSFGLPLAMYFKTLMKADKHLVLPDPRNPSVHLTTLLTLSEEQFRAWPKKLQHAKLRGEIVEPVKASG